MDLYFNKDKDNASDNELHQDQVIINNRSNNKRSSPNKRKSLPEFENYDINEQNEKKLNDKLDSVNNESDNINLTYAYKNCIEYDMSKRKREIRMKREDKGEMEKIRRWNIKISNIYITPLMKMVDPFFQFTIGGSFMVNVYQNKKGETYKIPAGTRGYADKTEVLKNVSAPQENEKNGGRTPFEKVIDIEMRMSYSMLSTGKMMIELWEHNNFWMNEIHSYITLPLIDIANGPSNISECMLKAEEQKKNPLPFALIEFNCLFQEIWDFNIAFLNWKSSTLQNIQKKKSELAPSTKIKIEFKDSSRDAVHSSCISEEAKETKGTSLGLENEEMKITLINTSGLFNRTLGEKTIGLKGILDFEKLKTDLIIRDKETDEPFSITIEGLVSFDNKPKYNQSGQNVLLLSTRKYLVLKVMRVENIRPAETRGVVNSFISVEWAGMNQRTRSVKENNNPSFNELLYFQVPLQEKWLNNIDKYILKINDELANKNEVIFNLMIEGDDNNNNAYDNFGISYFYLSEIKGGSMIQDHYFAEDLKKDKNYLTEKYSGKVKLISAFSQSTTTFLHFEAWFLDNFPPNVSFGEKKKESQRADKIPPDLRKYFPDGKDTIFNKEFKTKIHTIFLKYSNYEIKDRMFFNLTPQDQYTKTHLLPYYLSPITLPEKKYSIQDKKTNPHFFDCNLTALDEIAHFVRCFQFPNELKSDIWSSPDFMIKLRKGNVEEHAILMACLMLGIRKRIEPFSNDSGLEGEYEKETNQLITKGKTGRVQDTSGNADDSAQSKSEETEESHKGTFPFEHRVFLCLGKLKESKSNHMWVMTLDNGYRDITFWDPKLDVKFVLNGRVKEPEKLRHFIQGDYASYSSVNLNNMSTNGPEVEKLLKSRKRLKKDIDEVVLRGLKDESVYKYKDEDDFYDDFINESQSNLGIRKQDIQFMIDNKIAYDPNETQKRSVFDYVAHDQSIDKEIEKGNERNFLANEVFKDKTGEVVQDIQIPYETIDLICNQNNIWANCQYHGPDQIFYNLYDKTKWLPYCSMDDFIWGGKFEPFYSLSHFGPTYSPHLVNKMISHLNKEIRVGIASARSGKNLPTRFKKKNEKINQQLFKYLDYKENNKLNRLSDKEFKKKEGELNVVIKKYMPKFYRMEAQSVFYNYYETELIRRSITEDLEFFWNTKIKNIIFASCGKVYAYPNQIVSVRIIIARFYKIPLEDISNKEEEKEYIKMMKEESNNNKVEQEVESDEEAYEEKEAERNNEVKENLIPDSNKDNENKKKERKNKKPNELKNKKDNYKGNDNDNNEKKKILENRIVVESTSKRNNNTRN